MPIIDLDAQDVGRVSAAAATLRLAFADGRPWAAWEQPEDALAEVRASFGDGHVSLVALDGDAVAGWIGGARHYRGNTWELHPLAVHPAWQRRGIGRALVAALEERVAALGGRNIWLTTDDDTGATSLSDRDLYPDVLSTLATLEVSEGRVAFYFQLGYTLTGCIPDAYAPGHHELVFAKRLLPGTRDGGRGTRAEGRGTGDEGLGMRDEG